MCLITSLCNNPPLESMDPQRRSHTRSCPHPSEPALIKLKNLFASTFSLLLHRVQSTFAFITSFTYNLRTHSFAWFGHGLYQR